MPPTQLLVAQRRARYRSLEPVLSRWTRKLRAFVCFPVTFRSSLDRVPFAITSILVLFYAIAPGYRVDNSDSLGAVLFLSKYAFAMLLVSWFALLALTRQRINTLPLFPLAALALSVAGFFSFTYSIAVKPGLTTHASALIPLILPALPLVIPTRETRADGAVVAEYLFRIFGIAAIVYVLWFLMDFASGVGEGEPGDYTSGAIAFDPVFFMILAGLFRRKILLALSVGLIAMSLVLRPGSTTGFIALFATAVIVLYRLHHQRLIRATCVWLAGMICVANLVVFISGDVAQALYSIEPLMKEDVLKSTSNNAFRLALIKAARDEMADTSILTGKFFAGGVLVEIPGWGAMPIHSEYVIIIQQGGLIGYGLLTSLFVGLAVFLAKAACFAHTAGDAASEILFDAVQAINIAYMLAIGGSPTLDDPKITLHYLMLIPLTIFLARAQPGFADRRHRGTARYPRPSNVHRMLEA